MTRHEIYRKSEEYSLFFDAYQKDLTFDVYDHGEGVYIYDKDGNRYFDLASQYANVNIGYGNKDVIDAAMAQMQKLSYVKPLDTTEIRARLCEKLICEIVPKNMQKVMLTCGGSDANDYAVRLAKLATGRHKVLSQYGGYHGATVGASNLSMEKNREQQINGEYIHFFGYSSDIFRKHFRSDEEYCDYLIDLVDETIRAEDPMSIAAVLLDPVRQGGYVANKRFFQELRKICDKYGILLIFDEVLSGFGRTGKWFAFEHYDVLPDMITFAKGVTSSYVPLGGVLISSDICKRLEDTRCISQLTASFHPVACAAAYANICYMQQKKLVENAANVGEYLRQRLETDILPHLYVNEIRGMGLLQSIHLAGKLGAVSATNAICCMLKKAGYLTWIDSGHILIAPPLIINQGDVDGIIEAIKSLLDDLERVGYGDLLRFYPDYSSFMKEYYFPGFFSDLRGNIPNTGKTILLGSANAYYMRHIIGALKALNIDFTILLNRRLYSQILDLDDELCKKNDKSEYIIGEEDCIFFDNDKLEYMALRTQIDDICEKYDIKTVIMPYSRGDDGWVNIWDVAIHIADDVVIIDRHANISKKHVQDIPWYKYATSSHDDLHLGYFTDKFKLMPDQLDLVICGTTQAYFAFDTDAIIGWNSANMATLLNGFRFQRQILKRYRDRIQENALILLTVVYPVFLVNHDTLLRPETEFIYSRILGDDFNFSSNASMNGAILNPNYTFRQSLYDELIVDSIVNNHSNHFSDKEIEKRINFLITNGWERETYPIRIKDYSPNEQVDVKSSRKEHNIEQFIETIDYCKKNRWHPVIVGLPYSRELNDSLSVDFLQDGFYACIKEITYKTGIEFLDYSKDEEMSSIQNYMDVWFLNNSGRKLFTSKVLREVTIK